jgi:hypothetical protein
MSAWALAAAERSLAVRKCIPLVEPAICPTRGLQILSYGLRYAIDPQDRFFFALGGSAFFLESCIISPVDGTANNCLPIFDTFNLSSQMLVENSGHFLYLSDGVGTSLSSPLIRPQVRSLKLVRRQALFFSPKAIPLLTRLARISMQQTQAPGAACTPTKSTSKPATLQKFRGRHLCPDYPPRTHPAAKAWPSPESGYSAANRRGSLMMREYSSALMAGWNCQAPLPASRAVCASSTEG